MSDPAQDLLPRHTLTPRECQKKWAPLAGEGVAALFIATAIEDEIRWFEREGWRPTWLKWIFPAMRQAVAQLTSTAAFPGLVDVEEAVTQAVMHTVEHSDADIVDRVAALDLIESAEWLDYVKGLAPRVLASLRRVTE